MLATDYIRGHSPATTAVTTTTSEAAAAAMKFRAISPTDALSQELTMRSLLNSTYCAPVTLQMINSHHHHHRLASPSLLQYSTVDQSSSSMASFLADHYSRVIRSRAIARSLYDMERSSTIVGTGLHQKQHVYKCSPIPLKKAVRTKFVYGHSGLNKKKMQMMITSSSGVKPLGPPPALPRATLGQTVTPGLKVLKN
jgi:hypothetical protein